MNILLSEKIKKRIIKDNAFSLEIAMILNMKQSYIISLARRKEGHKNLIIHPIIEFYKSQGYSEEDIFEQIPKKVIK